MAKYTFKYESETGRDIIFETSINITNIEDVIDEIFDFLRGCGFTIKDITVVMEDEN